MPPTVDANRLTSDEIRFAEQDDGLRDPNRAAPSPHWRRARRPRQFLGRLMSGGATISPGGIALTQVLSDATSSASASVNATTPVLATK